MIRNLAIAIGAVLLIYSAQSHAIDCRAYQVADLKFEKIQSDFNDKIMGDPNLVRDGKLLIDEGAYWKLLLERFGEPLDKYADEYIKIHFGEEFPDGIPKEKALIASLEYRDLCPGRSLWDIFNLDTWLAYKSVCLHIGGGAFGTCGRRASEVAE